MNKGKDKKKEEYVMSFLKSLKSEISVKKIIVFIILLACLVFLLIQNESFLGRKNVKLDIKEGNPAGNVAEAISITKNTKFKQPFVAKTSKISETMIYFNNPKRYTEHTKLKVYLSDDNGKLVGKETLLSSGNIAHQTNTKVSFDGNSNVLNQNGITKIKKAMQNIKYINLEKGKKYFLNIEVSNVKPSSKFAIYLVKPGKGTENNDVIKDGKAISRKKVFSATTYYKRQYLLQIFFITIILLTMLFVLFPVEYLRKSSFGEKHKNFFDKYEKIFLRIMFWATPFFLYFILGKIAGYGTGGVFKQLFSLKGALNIFVIGVVWWLAYVLFNRIKYAIIVSTAIWFIFGLMNYLLILWRNSPLQALDVFSWQTGLQVASSYIIMFTRESIWAIVLSVVWISVAITLKGHKSLPLKQRIVPLLILCLWVTGIYGMIFTSNILAKNKIKINQFNPNWNYKKNGYALSFAASVGNAIVRKPKDYNAENVKKIMEQYKSDSVGKDNKISKKRPNIIVVMNESFAEMQELAKFKTNQEYMPFFNSMKKNTVRGIMHTSVLGSMTADTELEFLTGSSMHFYPAYSVPYVSMLHRNIPSMAWNMKKLGYEGNIAYHPGMVNSYNRNNVYPLLGFKKHLSIDDMKNPEKVREFVSDKADYDRVIAEYEKQKGNNSPFFMFNVTIQNHGGYKFNTGIIKEGIQVLDNNANGEQLGQYLNLIKNSDRALKGFIKYFEKEKEPTVIVFFGDHQPRVDPNFYAYADKQNINKTGVERFEKRYRVPFFIWANYDIKEEKNVTISANFLQSYLLKKIGMPMTGYNKFLYDTWKEAPAVTGVASMDKTGKIQDREESGNLKDIFRRYAMLQYNQVFDKKNHMEDFFLLNK